METNVDRVAGALRDVVGSVTSAVILGSGWAPVRGGAGVPVWSSTYAEVGLRPPVAPGHDGDIAVFERGNARILILSGRTHLYEGYGPREVAANVRVAAALGATTLVVTNANGALHHEWNLGDVVMLTDHLNLTGTSPLTGPDFVDLSNIYTPALRHGFRERAANSGVVLRDGVYAMLPGPHFETAAEANAIALLGADVLGMSTVLESIAARGCGMDVLGLSIVTAIENSGQEIDPDDVVRIAESTAAKLSGPVLDLLASL